eukprot:5802201-Alexandrium_andersonii.AAC.1
MGDDRQREGWACSCVSACDRAVLGRCRAVIDDTRVRMRCSGEAISRPSRGLGGISPSVKG